MISRSGRSSARRRALARPVTPAPITAQATNYEAAKLGFLSRYLIGSTLSGSFTRVLDDEELASLGSLKEWGIL